MPRQLRDRGGPLATLQLVKLSDLWIDDDLSPSGQRFNIPLLLDLRRGSIRRYSDLEAAITLARIAHDQFQRYGTDASHELTDVQSREVVRALTAIADRLGVPFDPPFRDFSGFKAYWASHGGYGSWAVRRTMAHDIFGPLLGELERREDDALRGELAEPVSPEQTGWSAVDEEIAELRRHFHAAVTLQDYRNIGNDIVAVLEALSAAAYDPERHLRTGETEPPVAQTKNRLARIVEVDSEPEGSDELTRLAKAAVELAQAVKHNPAGSRVRAGIAADAVIQLANMFRRLQDDQTLVGHAGEDGGENGTGD